METPGRADSSSAWTDPAGRLAAPDGRTPSPAGGAGPPPAGPPPADELASLSDPCVSASESRKPIGDLTAWLILSVDGRSGKFPRTSASSRSRMRRKSPHREPTWRATLGSLSGPRTMTATNKTTRSLAGLRIDTRPLYRGAGRRRGPRPRLRPTGPSDALGLAERPHHGYGPADDERLRDRPEVPAVLGIRPVVPHDEVLPRRDLDRTGHVVLRVLVVGQRTGIARRPRREPRLGQQLPVDVDVAVLGRDRLSRQTDDPLDQIREVLHLEGRALEHDDVTPVDAVEVVAQLVDHDPVPDLERRDHRRRRDVERLDDVGPQQYRAQEHGHQDDGPFDHPPVAAAPGAPRAQSAVTLVDRFGGGDGTWCGHAGRRRRGPGERAVGRVAGHSETTLADVRGTARSDRDAHSPAISFSTRSSLDLNGSFRSTVRWAWSFSFRWTQSTVKSRRFSLARLTNSPRRRARVVWGMSLIHI